MGYLRIFSNMELLEKKEYLNELFSLYHELFTKRQKEYFKLYYFEDFSLQEISDECSVSRNAVFDQLKHVEAHLLDYEEKLGLHKLRLERLEYLKKFEETEDVKYLDKLRKMDE